MYAVYIHSKCLDFRTAMAYTLEDCPPLILQQMMSWDKRESQDQRSWRCWSATAYLSGQKPAYFAVNLQRMQRPLPSPSSGDVPSISYSSVSECYAVMSKNCFLGATCWKLDPICGDRWKNTRSWEADTYRSTVITCLGFVIFLL